MNNKSENLVPIHPILPRAKIWRTALILFWLLAGILVSTSALAKEKTPTRKSRFAPQLVADGRARPQKTTQNSGYVKLSKFVNDYFKQTAHYQDGNLIVRKEAKAVIQLLQKNGYQIPNPGEILPKTLSEGSFLAQTLRTTPQGRKFMQRIASYPLAYDQLDRLATQPVGRRTVVDLVRGPDGYKMLDYMNTSPYGKNLGKMLSQDPKGGNFNKPTGRIYTAKQLIDAIWEQQAPKTSVK